MVAPLVVLAIFSFGVGWIGMPHVGGLPNYLGDWLGPSIYRIEYDEATMAAFGARDVHGGLLVAFIAIALMVGIAGIAGALWLYRRGPSETVERLTAGGIGARLYTAAKNKFYVDELYDLVIVRPFRWLAYALWDVADKFVIDTIFVRGSAFVVDVFGRIARWFQNGQVQRYVVGVLLGAAAIFFFTTWQTRAGIAFVEQEARGTVEVRAEIGGGPGAQNETSRSIRWDVNGDGKPDAAYDGMAMVVVPRQQLIQAGKVTLWVTDGVFGKRMEVTRRYAPPADAPADAAGGAR
jgi:NADH-quinone oxidoreductase subunit L